MPLSLALAVTALTDEGRQEYSGILGKDSETYSCRYNSDVREMKTRTQVQMSETTSKPLFFFPPIEKANIPFNAYCPLQWMEVCSVT